MNEEEKEAIEYLENLHPMIWWQLPDRQGRLKRDIPLSNAIDSVLNLIEKQQKELEEKQKSYDIAYKQGKAFENHRWKSLVRDILKKYAHTTIDDEENIINFYNEVKELLGDDK